MNDMLVTLAITGLSVAFFHAALPTHWLPFVLAGRGQAWSQNKTLWIATFAGLGHTLLTTLLDALVVFLGIKTEMWTGEIFPYIAGSVLVAFGLYYFWRQHKGLRGHHHWSFGGSDHCCDHDHDHSHHKPRSDKAVILGLLALLTFSPCEAFLPVYLSGISYEWSGFIFLSLILGVGTIAGMVLFTWITITGLAHVHLKLLEKYEAGLLGTVLCLLGIFVAFTGHHHHH